MKISEKAVPFQQARVRIPNFVVHCIKWFNWTSGVGFFYPAYSDRRNPNPTPPKSSDSATLV